MQVWCQHTATRIFYTKKVTLTYSYLHYSVTSVDELLTIVTYRMYFTVTDLLSVFGYTDTEKQDTDISRFIIDAILYNRRV